MPTTFAAPPQSPLAHLQPRPWPLSLSLNARAAPPARPRKVLSDVHRIWDNAAQYNDAQGGGEYASPAIAASAEEMRSHAQQKREQLWQGDVPSTLYFILYTVTFHILYTVERWCAESRAACAAPTAARYYSAALASPQRAGMPDATAIEYTSRSTGKQASQPPEAGQAEAGPRQPPR